MRRLAFLLLLASAGACTGASAAPYHRIDAAQSRIGFVSHQMGVPVEGRFRRFDATLNLDLQAAAAARGTLRIDLASVDSGNREADAELQGADWFDVRQHPDAQYVLQRLEPQGGGRWRILGQLELRGVSRPLGCDAKLGDESAQRALLDGSCTFKRLDFGVGTGAWGDTSVVANEVTVRFHLVLEP
ncbi:MAG: YceI family protein [Proteobacteria bacterium]|nr:YceI family protein [Pseudomonadota bacterium]